MRRVARAAVVAATAAGASASACFSKPGEPHERDDAAMSGTDGRTGGDGGDAPSSGTCDIAHDDFELASSDACGDWATTALPAGVSIARTGGKLGMSFQAGKSGECTTASPFKISNGASLEIESSTFSFTYFRLVFPDAAAGQQVGIGYGSGMLNLSCPGPVTNLSAFVTPPVFVRVTANLGSQPGTVSIDARYSATNDTFASQIGTCTFDLATLDKAIATFGGNGSGGPTTATFDEFNTYMCPPP